MKINFLTSRGFFTNLEEWNIDAFKRAYFQMISYNENVRELAYNKDFLKVFIKSCY